MLSEHNGCFGHELIESTHGFHDSSSFIRQTLRRAGAHQLGNGSYPNVLFQNSGHIHQGLPQQRCINMLPLSSMSRITRAALYSLISLRCSSQTLSKVCSIQAQTIRTTSRAQQPSGDHDPFVASGVRRVSEGLLHEGGFIKGHPDRCQPLSSYEAFLKRDSSFGSASTPVPDKTSKGIVVKWGAASSEPGLTLRGDPLEWYQHHITGLEEYSRARTEVPIEETKFLLQLTREHVSAGDKPLSETSSESLNACKGERKPAGKGGQLGDPPLSNKLVKLWIPALQEAIKNEQMLVRGTFSPIYVCIYLGGI